MNSVALKGLIWSARVENSFKMPSTRESSIFYRGGNVLKQNGCLRGYFIEFNAMLDEITGQ